MSCDCYYNGCDNIDNVGDASLRHLVFVVCLSDGIVCVLIFAAGDQYFLNTQKFQKYCKGDSGSCEEKVSCNKCATTAFKLHAAQVGKPCPYHAIRHTVGYNTISDST